MRNGSLFNLLSRAIVLVALASLSIVLSMSVVAAGVRFGRREDVVLERNFPTTDDLLMTKIVWGQDSRCWYEHLSRAALLDDRNYISWCSESEDWIYDNGVMIFLYLFQRSSQCAISFMLGRKYHVSYKIIFCKSICIAMNHHRSDLESSAVIAEI